jgi:hypothetical protein
VQNKIVWTPDTIAAVLGDFERQNDALLAESQSAPPKELTNLNNIALTTAKLRSAPMQVLFPWKSIFAYDGSDSSTYVWVVPWTEDTLQDPFKLRVNDSLYFPKPVTRCFIYWEAQTGKSMSISFFRTGEFRSGSSTSVSAGGVSISEGSIVGATATTTLVAATAAAICAQNYSRKVTSIYNDTGGTIYLSGASTVTDSGATKGIPLASGGVSQWKNTGILYAYSVAGGAVLTMEET